MKTGRPSRLRRGCSTGDPAHEALRLDYGEAWEMAGGGKQAREEGRGSRDEAARLRHLGRAQCRNSVWGVQLEQGKMSIVLVQIEEIGTDVGFLVLPRKLRLAWPRAQG